MNLATRCTDCSTVFRVVPDQLKVSDGWVRCGRCNAVFNAQEQLFDLDAPLAATPGSPGALDHAGAQFTAPVETPAETPAVAPDAAGFEAQALAGSASSMPAAELAPSPASWARGERPAAEPASLPPLADDSPAAVVSIGASAANQEPPVRVDADEVQVVPSFMQGADGSAGRSGARARTATAVLAALLALTLGVQFALAWRNELAARTGTARAVLAQLCDLAGCRIDAPRRIEQLSVEASGLSRIEGAAMHRLTLTLRNRADTVVLPPAIELTLSDAQGALVARRVLGLEEFGLAVSAIDPGAELALQALIAAGDRRVAGYTVEAFYP